MTFLDGAKLPFEIWKTFLDPGLWGFWCSSLLIILLLVVIGWLLYYVFSRGEHDSKSSS